MSNKLTEIIVSPNGQGRQLTVVLGGFQFIQDEFQIVQYAIALFDEPLSLEGIDRNRHFPSSTWLATNWSRMN